MITRQLLYMCKVWNLFKDSEKQLKWANLKWASAILTKKRDAQEAQKFPLLSIDGVCASCFNFRAQKEGETLRAFHSGFVEGVSRLFLPFGDHLRDLQYAPFPLLPKRRPAAPQYVVAANGVLYLVDDVFRNTAQLFGRLESRTAVLLPAFARFAGYRRGCRTPRQHLDTKKTILNGVAKNARC